jgi:hypothetical protein
MDCAHVRMPGGGVAIVCGRGMRRARRCRHCACDASFLCDGKIEALGTVNTCDRPICSAHAFEIAPEKHLCPAHLVAYIAWLQRQCIAY